MDGVGEYIYVRHYTNGTVSRVLKPASYAERIDTHDTVVPGQLYAAVMFEPSLRAKPDTDAVYGLIQVVGCFPNEGECTEFIRKRVLASSRRDEYLLMPCGSFVALSTAPAALRDVELVDLEQKLHGEYQDAQNRRSQKEAEQLRERQEKLAKEKDDALRDGNTRQENTLQKAEHSNDLESYVRLRVARASALAAAHRMSKQMDRIVSMRDKMLDRGRHFENVLREKDSAHPTYSAQYLDVYCDTLVAACTMVRDDDDEADYNHLNYDDEPGIKIASRVNPLIQTKFKKQSHEDDDDEPPMPPL